MLTEVSLGKGKGCNDLGVLVFRTTSFQIRMEVSKEEARCLRNILCAARLMTESQRGEVGGRHSWRAIGYLKLQMAS